MTSTGWFSKTVLYSGILAAILLPVAALGYKFRLLDLMVSFGILRVCLMGGLVVIIAAVVNIILGKKYAHTERIMESWLAIALAIVPVGVMCFQILKATSVPPIHNISTDVVNPPEFNAVIALRGENSNPLAFGSEGMPREKLIELQEAAYPEVKTIHSDQSPSVAFDHALLLLDRLGLDVVNEDRGRGIIEAVDTSFWFGFKDDLIVRIQSEEGGSAIDLRSVSRVGQSDLGANAARIVKFVRAF